MNKGYTKVDDLFGKILGIERVLLCDKQYDTLEQVIEKIGLIPEHKLLVVERVQSKNLLTRPQVRNVISYSDICSVFKSLECV